MKTAYLVLMTVTAASVTTACTGDSAPVTSAPQHATQTRTSSPSQTPASGTANTIGPSGPAPAKPVDLAELASADSRILAENVTAKAHLQIVSSSPCTDRIESRLDRAGTSIYGQCSDLESPTPSPMRSIAAGASLRDIIDAHFAPLTPVERAAGFEGDPAQPTTHPYAAKVIDHVAIIDFLDTLPRNLNFPTPRIMLTASVTTNIPGVRGISLLLRHQVTCQETSCP